MIEPTRAQLKKALSLTDNLTRAVYREYARGKASSAIAVAAAMKTIRRTIRENKIDEKGKTLLEREPVT